MTTDEIRARDCWLLDLDGTLVDSSEGVIRAFHSAQAAFGEAPADPQAIAATIGYPLRDTIHTYSSIPYDDFFPHFRQEAMTSMHLHSRLLPGAAEFLKTLAAQGKRICLVTSKLSDNAARILEHLGVGGYFELMVGHECCTKKKPDPEPILFALNKLGADPDDAVMVGDTINDIESAHAARVPVVAVASGFDPPEKLRAADLVLDSTAALLTLVRNGGTR